MNFTFYQPSKIHFGPGKLNEIGQIAKVYGTKCLLITTINEAPLDSLYTRVINLLSKDGIGVIHYDGVTPNPSTEVIEKGFLLAKEHNVDFVLAVGGGSSIDTAKVVALTYGLKKIDWNHIFENYTNPFGNYKPLSNQGLPLIAVSTTSGTGSQVTQAAVISEGNNKNTIFHPNNFSDECIVDPELMTTLPPRLTAATGFDAFCHAFESYINPRASYFTEYQSLNAIELIKENLPKALKDGSNIDYRTNLALADTLAGTCLANAGAAAPHPLSEIIGGVAHISHGEALAIVFPAFMKHEYKNNIAKFAKVARIFNPSLNNVSDEKAAENSSDAIVDFLKKINLSVTLKDFNVSEEQFNEIINCPILNFLPFGSKEDLQNIIKESY
ncbi:iron-containing alcohol dehydrogenase [Clostridium sediminicola]|uniref:iron-containing alcohol dehydrogenase n=1 Tax=Clostridium sediminicola TaxID=3114879 RepID=UPI0031F1E04B